MKPIPIIILIQEVRYRARLEINGRLGYAGSTWEYVMAIIQTSDILHPVTVANSASNSSFNGFYLDGSGEKTNGLSWSDDRYYDVYEYATSFDSFY